MIHINKQIINYYLIVIYAVHTLQSTDLFFIVFT